MAVDQTARISLVLAANLHLASIAATACLLVATGSPVQADGDQRDGPLRINEIMAGANGDSRLQFIELNAPKRRDGAPPSAGPRRDGARAVLSFHDATGLQTDEFEIPERQGRDRSRGHTILLATQVFARELGLEPDFVMPQQISAPDGAICLHRIRPGRGRGTQVDCVAYGRLQGHTPADACVAFAPALPVAGPTPVSLVRIPDDRPRAEDCSTSRVYSLSDPSPLSGAGRTAAIPARELAVQGRNLFELETFGGNGRTCSTCHAANDLFGLSPDSIAVRFEKDPLDPLFVAENDPTLDELENACLMRMGDERGLILENVDGFDRPPVFRHSPSLRNLEATAPYGLSGEFDDLQSFSAVAVRQHFPRTLARNSDPLTGPLDFREPTAFELEALESFMQAIRFPADGDLDLERMIGAAVDRGADESAIRRGQDLFFGTTGSAQCFRCHSGPTLSDADGSLGMGTGNAEFDIGIAFLPHNGDDGCAGGPGDPAAALPGDFRRFSTPSLLGVANLVAFFHDNSVSDFRSAVSHYTSPPFEFSEANLLMEEFTIVMTDGEVDDIVAFLEAISVDPSRPLAPRGRD